MSASAPGYRVMSLFSGIGGIEMGLHGAGHRTTVFCEIDPGAQAVLNAHFSGVPVVSDIRDIDRAARGTQLIAAGFPCQDLSQAGKTKGLAGPNSGLVNEMLRILGSSDVPHVLIENVSFMLRIGRGAAIRSICDALEGLGYRWAYRVVDTRAFGLPQRRERVILLASRELRPEELLFQDIADPDVPPYSASLACGFYWTEGTRGLGFAVDAIPTLKGGSTIGIPSAPAIWLPDGSFVTPDIRDAERIQGFPADWTRPAELAGKRGHRWKLIGNAVSVPVAAWAGSLLQRRPRPVSVSTQPLDPGRTWPNAALGAPGEPRLAAEVGSWPVSAPKQHLATFLQYPPRPLSDKAVDGFLGRLTSGSLRCYPDEFVPALRRYRSRTSLFEELPTCAAS